MRYHRPRELVRANLAQIGAREAYIVEDVKISIARVPSGHDRAIVWNLDGVVERIQIDAFHDEPGHVGGLARLA
jgi:hypothetical protein